jgi:N-acetylmuramoyl-L-alanine amidase
MAIAWIDPNKIKFITIHCTATPEGRDNTAAEVTRWDIELFGQPSYHHVFELDGDDVQTLRYDQRGAHVGKNNTGNIGLSYVGGTATMNSGAKPKDTRTDAQKRAMEARLRELLNRYPNAKVRGHRDWLGTKKACPSFDVKTWLTSIGLGKYFG